MKSPWRRCRHGKPSACAGVSRATCIRSAGLQGGAADPAWSGLIADQVLLAGLPELHEGYAALFRQLHPDGEPYPTVALALHWLEGERPYATGAVRDAVEELLLHSRLAALGLLRLEGRSPWHGRLLRPGPGVWQAVQARPPLPGDGLLVGGRRNRVTSALACGRGRRGRPGLASRGWRRAPAGTRCCRRRPPNASCRKPCCACASK